MKEHNFMKAKTKEKAFTFKRECRKCNQLFTPTGKFSKVCPNCLSVADKKRLKIIK